MSFDDKIAEQVKRIPRSGIRDFFELVLGRDDVISLGVGEPDFASPWHIREAAIYSLEKGETSYTSNLGLEKLRKSISLYVREQFEVDYDPLKEVLVTVGVSEALDLACRALLNPGMRLSIMNLAMFLMTQVLLLPMECQLQFQLVLRIILKLRQRKLKRN